MSSLAAIGVVVLIAIQGLAICYLVREVTRLSSLMDDFLSGTTSVAGVTQGMDGPDLSSFKDLRNGVRFDPSLFVGNHTVVLFVAVSCPACRWLLQELSNRIGGISSDPVCPIVVVCQGPVHASGSNVWNVAMLTATSCVQLF